MSDIICVTNRKLCKGDFFERIEKIAQEKPKAIILREKDLDESEYTDFAKSVIKICQKHDTPCILHSFTDAAMLLHADSVHLPLPLLRKMTEYEKTHFKHIGSSCHSLEDAKEAEKLGCSYLTAGHIFNTDCKKDIPPRGLDFLSKICSAVSIPVYAIGGIDHASISSVIKAGAAGGCIMSGLMICENVKKYMEGFKR